MFKNSQGKIRSGWIILLAFIGVMLSQSIFMLPGSVLYFNKMHREGQDMASLDIMVIMDQEPWIFLAMQGGGTIGGIIITYLLWRFLHKRRLLDLGFRWKGSDLLFGLLLGAVSITSIVIILLLTGNVQFANNLFSPVFSIYIITFLIMFVLVGIFEEMFFRGYVMTIMEERKNRKWVIYVVSALFFSIVHGANPNVSIIGLLNIVLVGLLFAYMFDVTKSLWAPIGYHITWNYFQGNVFGFAVSGTKPYGIYQAEVERGNDFLTGGSFGIEGGILATFAILFSFFITKLFAKNRT